MLSCLRVLLPSGRQPQLPWASLCGCSLSIKAHLYSADSFQLSTSDVRVRLVLLAVHQYKKLLP